MSLDHWRSAINFQSKCQGFWNWLQNNRFGNICTFLCGNRQSPRPPPPTRSPYQHLLRKLSPQKKPKKWPSKFLKKLFFVRIIFRRIFNIKLGFRKRKYNVFRRRRINYLRNKWNLNEFYASTIVIDPFYKKKKKYASKFYF